MFNCLVVKMSVLGYIKFMSRLFWNLLPDKIVGRKTLEGYETNLEQIIAHFENFNEQRVSKCININGRKGRGKNYHSLSKRSPEEVIQYLKKNFSFTSCGADHNVYEIRKDRIAHLIVLCNKNKFSGNINEAALIEYTIDNKLKNQNKYATFEKIKKNFPYFSGWNCAIKQVEKNRARRKEIGWEKYFEERRNRMPIPDWDDIKLLLHAAYATLPLIPLFIGIDYAIQGAITKEWNRSKQDQAWLSMRKQDQLYDKVFGKYGLADTNSDGEISILEKTEAYKKMGLENKTKFVKPTISQLEKAIKSYKNKKL